WGFRSTRREDRRGPERPGSGSRTRKAGQGEGTGKPLLRADGKPREDLRTSGGGKLNLEGAGVLVTGGAGFIGSHLTERLLGMGASVTVYDRFDDFYQGKERNLAGAANNPRFRL